MIDVGIFGDIAWDQQRIASESACQFFHIFFKPLALIRERQLRAGLSPGLRNRPGDGPLIRDAKDDPNFSVQQ